MSGVMKVNKYFINIVSTLLDQYKETQILQDQRKQYRDCQELRLEGLEGQKFSLWVILPLAGSVFEQTARARVTGSLQYSLTGRNGEINFSFRPLVQDGAESQEGGRPGQDRGEIKSTESKKAILKGVHSHKKKKIRTSPTFRGLKTLSLRRQPRYPRKSAPRRNKLDHYTIIKFPLTTESTMKKIEDNNTLVFIMDVKANKHQIKQAVKKLYDIDVPKVRTKLSRSFLQERLQEVLRFAQSVFCY
ncbi:hypothetical protein JRQ81_014125 [Phrynocephalus forsythii]|uniref:Large ribosomal subunit protein uL23 N-terminal domain-containing protein n=1 Tax=Phrynocephalus forsythii TaxID=171643 RepID=A0A9Q0XY05_9SAUR|nr:hypothetical protein JRQ81_014125 [Phrynocephalus forsythii]